jgi:imidazolonepropionase-like amidohydrolase
VIVENGRVARVDSGFTAPAGAILVDERSRTVMPGMTDVHVHLTQNSGEPWYIGFTKKYSNAYGVTLGLTHALDMARAGFTTVRDLGGDTSVVIAVRDAVGEGRFPGPRIRVSGAPLSIVGGHADEATGLPPELAEAVNEAHLNPSVCTGVEECQKVVRQLAAAGVDVIKVMATGGVLDPGAMGLEQHFTDAELKGIVDMAHSLHLKTAAHAHGARGILAATNAGIDSIEHGTFLDEAGARDEGPRHLLFRDPNGVQRRPEPARHRQARAGIGSEGEADLRGLGQGTEPRLSDRREDRAWNRQRGRSPQPCQPRG